MATESLTPDERALVRRCLALAVTTPELQGEFSTRLGVSRGQAAELLARWPAVDDRDDASTAAIAINNALNEVANGLRLSSADWAALAASREEVVRVYDRWAALRGWRSTGLR